MQIVIDMPRKNYEEILHRGLDGSNLAPLYEALVNSIPLPERHGDLIDKGALYDLLSEVDTDDAPDALGIGLYIEELPVVLEYYEE